MNSLSTNSMIKVLSCLKHKNDLDSIDSLRRTSYFYNEIAKKDGFDKINAMEIRINLDTAPNTNIKSLTVVIVPENACKGFNDNIFTSPGYAPNGGPLYKVLFPNSRNGTVIVKPKISTINEEQVEDIVYNVLVRILRKIKNIAQFSIFGFDLTGKLVETLKQLHKSTKNVQILNIQKCNIKTTTEEMSTLLGIFNNIHSLCIVGLFESQCLVDEHLLSISDHIHICHGNEFHIPRTRRRQEDAQPLHGISSLLCSHWTKNPPKSVMFDNIITKIQFNSVWSLLTTTSTKNIDSSSGNDRQINIGPVEVEPTFAAELPKLQRRNEFQWTINEDERRKNTYTIRSTKSSVSVEFDAVPPYIKSELSKFSDKVAGIKNYVETTTTFSWAEESYVERQLSAIEQHLYDYEQHYKLVDPQIDLVQMQQRQRTRGGAEDAVQDIIGNTQALMRRIDTHDEREMMIGLMENLRNAMHRATDLNRADRFRRETLQDINRLEQIIQLRMGQPVPEEP